MEDITFLEDYQYQLKLNELDRNLMAMECLSMEVANGLTAIHNAAVVEQYGDKYGYTEHFQMLIGEEGFFDSAAKVLANVVKWLKKKLIQLASLIFNIINLVSDTISILAWVIVNHSRMNATKSPYDIEDLDSVFVNIFYTATHKCPFDKLVNSATNISEFTDALSEYLNNNYKDLEGRVAKCKVETSYARMNFRNYAQELEYTINNSYVVTLNTLGKVVDTLQKSLNENDNLERIQQKTIEFMKRLPEGQPFLKAFANSKLCKSTEIKSDTADNILLSLFRTQASLCIAFSTIYSQFYNKCIRRGISILKELHEAYNKGEATIHMEFPFDQTMIKRLSEFYGAPIKVTKLTVTNASPSTWNFANETSCVAGWCYGGDGSGVSFPTELWVSVRFIMSWVARFSGAVFADGRVNKYDNFIGTIVHECKHLWDLQYGKEFDIVQQGDSFFKYRNSQHERRAREAASKFEITDQDRSWAKKIIDQVEAEVKKQKSR